MKPTDTQRKAWLMRPDTMICRHALVIGYIWLAETKSGVFSRCSGPTKFAAIDKAVAHELKMKEGKKS